LVEPTLLYLLAKRGMTHGYEMVAEANRLGLSDGEIDAGAVYRTLRQMERDGLVCSTWHTGGGGPARRTYELTPAGRDRLREWSAVIGRLAARMVEFAAEAAALTGHGPATGAASGQGPSPEKEGSPEG